MKADYLTKIMDKVDAFPSIPGSAVRLLELVDQADAPIDEIEEVLRLDPGLTANVLKLTNSAFFGLPAKVGSVKRAVMLLGLNKLKQLIMASCVNAVMDKDIPGYDLPAGELWRHSIAVSVAAEGLVRELNLDSGDDIFTAALLHDVGKLVLGQFIDEDYAALAAAAGNSVSFEIAEKEVLGTDHAEVGARILEHWALPDALVHAVRWHHNPENAEEVHPSTDIVHVANMLCLMLGIGVGREGLQYQPSPVVTRRLGLKPFHLEKLASQTIQTMGDLADVFINSETA
ncbi:MAG: HDOD domain-containing protein [Desulfobacterales bacterium]|nr:HDOD domain-containing protein [Desulfobacterales bacterium]MDJ0874246.1 HDOD domain-containing protein [Desulfobacterales bacterium]MDJ0884658.1 HDOD domain-containing protein [Desulfobacterales bacterium]